MEKVKTAVDTVDVVEKMARTQDLDGNVVHTKDLIKAKSALHVLFSKPVDCFDKLKRMDGPFF